MLSVTRKINANITLRFMLPESLSSECHPLSWGELRICTLQLDHIIFMGAEGKWFYVGAWLQYRDKLKRILK